MTYTASIRNSLELNELKVESKGIEKRISIPAKPGGNGSSVSGAELLLLALATCACNDIYREASKRKIVIQSVQVTATGEFVKAGEAGSNFRYKVKVQSDAPPEAIRKLIDDVDKVVEIHNTLRTGARIVLEE